VEIAKALYRGVDLLILDEPTAVLTPQETSDLFKTLRRLTNSGLSIIFITHKLNEVMAAADRVSVLRDGRLVATKPTQETDQGELAFMMVDRAVSFSYQKPEPAVGESVLVVDGLTVKEKAHKSVQDVSFEVRAGEILGIAGVDGNGQNELALAITGLLRPSAGRILLHDKDVTHRPVRQLNRAGLGHIPADRHKMGIILGFSVADNLILQKFYRRPFTSGLGILNRRAAAEYAQRLVASFDIRTSSIHTRLDHLSGGNQQKVVLAREIDQNPQVLVAVQPTRGLDVGAMEYVHRLLLEQRARGTAILLISTELEEILELSDRIDVMYGGRIVGQVSGGRADIQAIGRMMAGMQAA
jgi:simple sugar transport system ATP-binding protein